MKQVRPIEIKPHVRQHSQSRELAKSQIDYQKLVSSFINGLEAAPNTIRTYKAALKRWLDYLDQRHIVFPKDSDVKQYKKDLLASGKKRTTVQNYFMGIKQFYKWTDQRRIYPDITKTVKSVKLGKGFKKDYLNPKQVRHVLAVISQNSLKGKRDYAMLLVMFTMGLRTVEVSRANIGDLQTAPSSTVLKVQGKGHVDKDAEVPMPDRVEDAVRAYLKARKASKPDLPLFSSTSHNNSGQRMTTRSISRTVKQYFIKAGYNSPRLTAHSTRHTAATLSLLNGATLQETQALLRHKNMQTTEIYAHNLEAARNPAANDVENAIFGISNKKDTLNNENASNNRDQSEGRHRKNDSNTIFNGWVISQG